jgi:hypothetical protein
MGDEEWLRRTGDGENTKRTKARNAGEFAHQTRRRIRMKQPACLSRQTAYLDTVSITSFRNIYSGPARRMFKVGPKSS